MTPRVRIFLLVFIAVAVLAGLWAAYPRSRERWVDVGSAGDYPPGSVTYLPSRGIQLGLFLVHRNDNWLALSERPPNPLGCPLTWRPHEGNRFDDGCLGIRFDANGMNGEGPTPRREMFRQPVRIAGNRILVLVTPDVPRQQPVDIFQVVRHDGGIRSIGLRNNTDEQMRNVYVETDDGTPLLPALRDDDGWPYPDTTQVAANGLPPPIPLPPMGRGPMGQLHAVAPAIPREFRRVVITYQVLSQPGVKHRLELDVPQRIQPQK